MGTFVRSRDFEEKLFYLHKGLDFIDDIVDQLEKTIVFKNNIIYGFPNGFEDVETLINGMLAQSGSSSVFNFSTYLSNLFSSPTYDAKTFPYSREMMFNPKAWESTKITVSNSTLTINQSETVAIFDVISTPAGGFVEQVEIYEAEDPAHNGLYDISSTTDQTLVVTNPSLKGKDNFTDKSVKVRYLSRRTT